MHIHIEEQQAVVLLTIHIQCAHQPGALASWPFQREFDPDTSKAVKDATPIISRIHDECENKSMAYITYITLHVKTFM
jgi:hypothetical protein